MTPDMMTDNLARAQDTIARLTAELTAALDKLIAVAEARVWKQAAIIANKLLVRSKFGDDTPTEVVYSDFVGAAILAASKKGGA